MCEALIGAVAFHTTTIQALRVAGFIIGIGKNEMQILIKGHKQGYVPYCVAKQLDENDPILSTPEALQRIAILEGIQQLFPRFSLLRRHHYRSQSMAYMSINAFVPGKPYYNYQVHVHHSIHFADS